MSAPKAIVFDIETAPSKNAELIIDETTRPDARLKDPEKIRLNIVDKKAKALSKAALHWSTGQVFCVNFYDTEKNQHHFLYDRNEKNLLIAFGNKLEGDFINHQTVAKNIEFDRPFLCGRYIVHDLGIPTVLRQTPVSQIQDIEHFITRSKSSNQHAKLEAYALAMSVGNKTMSGSDVGDLYLKWIMEDDQDAIKKLNEYCKRDVDITREVYRRGAKTFEPQAVTCESDIPFGA